MGINLVKGQTIDLRKNESGGENNLSSVTIGLGWDINDMDGSAYDLDAVAVLLDKNGKIADNSDVVYYGNKMHKSNNIWSTGDNLTGAGEGDDEQIIVKLDKIDQKYEKIVFFVSIYQGSSRNQHFGMMKNAYIRAMDASNKELCKYNISQDSALINKRSYIFSEVYRKDGTWKFRALGESRDTDSLNLIVESYR